MSIYVSGIGAVSAAGNDIREISERIRAGKTALHEPRRLRTRLKVPEGEAGLSDIDLKKELGIGGIMSRTALLGLKAAKEALDDFAARTGVRKPSGAVFISGTSVGGMDLSEVFWENHRGDLSGGDVRLLKMHSPGAVTQAMDEWLVSRGLMDEPALAGTVSTACSAAGNTIMTGARMLQAGLADVALVGGTDSLCRFTMNGFHALHILDSDICRPFDETRAGLNLGEGAGYLVLTTSGPEGAYCRLTGWGNANEAYHQTASTPEGAGPGMAMEAALSEAGLEPSDIDFINTHGTGTLSNDAAELNAMRRVFGNNVPPFSSLKNIIGHTLGASEGIEAAWVCSMMESRRNGFRNVMSSAFGFSGNCVSLIFSE